MHGNANRAGVVGNGPRNCRVKVDLLNRLIPEFRPEFTLETGMEELHRQMVDHGFSAADFEGKQFVRLRWLRDRLDRLNVASRA